MKSKYEFSIVRHKKEYKVMMFPQERNINNIFRTEVYIDAFDRGGKFELQLWNIEKTIYIDLSGVKEVGKLMRKKALELIDEKNKQKRMEKE